MGCNVLITTDENFRRVNLVRLAEYTPTQGFSSFKFLPGTSDSIIIALQTEEDKGRTATYVTAFTTKGSIVLPSTLVDNEHKYEGFEFI